MEKTCRKYGLNTFPLRARAISRRTFVMNDELVYMVISQKIGKALPLVAATLIERLPDENDPEVEDHLHQEVLNLNGPWGKRLRKMWLLYLT
jgi:hypothetical protein